MSLGVVTTAERSNPYVSELLQARKAETHPSLTLSELVGHLVVPEQVKEADAPHMLVIAGGAASGKSRLAKGMHETFANQGITAAIISSDDYVRGDRGMRRTWEDEGKGPDEKYDFDYMRAVIRAICANRDPEKRVIAPKYDAQTGLALASKRRRQIPPVDMLVVEGDMLGERGTMPKALYPSGLLAADPQLLYIHLSDEQRLAYRLARDMEHRNGHGETPDVIAQNFEHRQLAQHLPYTLGYAATANVIVQAEHAAPNETQHYDMWRMHTAQ
ncbi:MAG TPA: hypothetical protein VD735_04145 [Candidatus Saccharimonadales bacterium]|nr:hypothetical protein [Candidatus Saccharimonadales bacterium]